MLFNGLLFNTTLYYIVIVKTYYQPNIFNLKTRDLRNILKDEISELILGVKQNRIILCHENRSYNFKKTVNELGLK